MSPSELRNDIASARGIVRAVEWRGDRWEVWEGFQGQLDRRSRPDLFFASSMAVRRVRDFPRNWRELSDADLMAVSEHR